MLPSMPGLPLLIVVEGENDIRFLKAMSALLHRHQHDSPDLTHERRTIFLPTGGSNLQAWVSRITSLHKRTFYLFDREQEPETSERRQIVEAVNSQAGCFAAMTSKRAVENYLHPSAIFAACGIELSFDDDMDVASLLALKMLERGDANLSWHQLPSKRQRRVHDKAKKVLNIKAAQRMTPALLAQQDPDDEIIGWMRSIRQLIEMKS